MHIPSEAAGWLQRWIRKLHSLEFDESLIHDSAQVVSRLINADYFALRLFPNVRKDLPIIVSNDPLDSMSIHFTAIDMGCLIIEYLF